MLFCEKHKTVSILMNLSDPFEKKDIPKSILDKRIEFANTFLNHIKVTGNKALGQNSFSSQP